MLAPFARLRRAVVALSVVLAILALPSAASAKGLYDIERQGVATRMSLRGTNGYSITVVGASRHGVLLLAIKRGRKSAVLATYEVPGRVTGKRLRADFGRSGRISVRFRPIGRPRVKRPPAAIECRGRDPIQEFGRFEGTIRFRGDAGFTEVAVRSAKGTLVRGFKRSCVKARAAGAWAAAADDAESEAGTALLVKGRSTGRAVNLAIVNTELETGDGGSDLFLSIVTASTIERRGRMRVTKFAALSGDRSSLITSPVGVEPVTATVSLPSPFSGTGSYLEQAGSQPSWTGSLKVRLPGAEVPLVGSGFNAALCNEKSPKKFEVCVDEAKKRFTGAPTEPFALRQRLPLPALRRG